MGLVSHHWSGKHLRAVQDINLTTLLWTGGAAGMPCDCRLYEVAADKKKQVTKNDHFLAMLQTAKERGSAPQKADRGHGWQWLTRRKSNSPVDPDGTGNVAVSAPSQRGKPAPASGQQAARVSVR